MAQQHQQVPGMVQLAILLKEGQVCVALYRSCILTSRQCFSDIMKRSRLTALKIEGDTRIADITACRHLGSEIRKLEAIVKNLIRCPPSGPYQDDKNNSQAALCMRNADIQIMTEAYSSMHDVKDDYLAGGLTHDESLEIIWALGENIVDAAYRIESDPDIHWCVVSKCRKLQEEFYQKEFELTSRMRPEVTLPIQATGS